MNSYFDVLRSKKYFNSTPSTQHFSFPSESFSYVIVQPSNSEVKFSGHLKSPLLKVKKKVKGPKFSRRAINSLFAFCQYLGVFFILSKTLHGSSRVKVELPSDPFLDFPRRPDMPIFLSICFFFNISSCAKYIRWIISKSLIFI